MAAQTIIPIIVLEPCFDEMLSDVHGHLIKTLKRTCTIKIVKNKAEAASVLSDPSVRVVIANDSDVAPTIKSANYLERGGTVIFAGLFSSFTSMPDFCKCFNSLGLPWKNGNYYRSDYFLTTAAESRFKGLPDSYNAKALLAAGVKPDDRVYTPSSQSHTQSLVFPSQQVQGGGLDETAVAFGPAGKGWVGYVGDVNGEEQTSYIILAMVQRAAQQK